MSDLGRSVLRKTLPRLPEIHENLGPVHDAHNKITSSAHGECSSSDAFCKHDVDELSENAWDTCFEEELILEPAGCDGLRVQAYLNRPTGQGPLYIAHHGAGSCALSFALLAQNLRRQEPESGFLAFDARGHGNTWHQSAPTLSDDISLRILSADLGHIVDSVLLQLATEPIPRLIVIGHSLGGAVAVDFVSNHPSSSMFTGLVVIDIVEGSAIEAQRKMRTYLEMRPDFFKSKASATEWHLRSRVLRNPESAKLSVPALIYPSESQDNVAAPQWTWRLDLRRTKPFWDEWFAGLSNKFLACKVAKQLILADHDYLDTPLMIGQMQGKFQFNVMAQSGHFVHEDAPEETADIISAFASRNMGPVLVPSLGSCKLP